MKIKKYTVAYTVAEAQRNFEKLILEAHQDIEVYIIEEGKQPVKVVPFKRDKKRKLADQKQI